ncbi:hypothetical protein D3C81_1675290 [compost metagenome]
MPVHAAADRQVRQYRHAIAAEEFELGLRCIAVEAAIRIGGDVTRGAEGQLQIVGHGAVHFKLGPFAHRPFCCAIGLLAGAVDELSADRLRRVFLLDTEYRNVGGQATVHPVGFQAGFVVFAGYRRQPRAIFAALGLRRENRGVTGVSRKRVGDIEHQAAVRSGVVFTHIAAAAVGAVLGVTRA